MDKPINNFIRHQQLQQQQQINQNNIPYKKPSSRLEKAKQFARGINNINNITNNQYENEYLERMSTHSSIASPFSSYSASPASFASPICSPNSNSISPPTTASSASSFLNNNNNNTHFYSPIITWAITEISQQQNQQQQQQQTSYELMNAFLPFYMNQFLNAFKMQSTNNANNLNFGDYFESLMTFVSTYQNALSQNLNLNNQNSNNNPTANKTTIQQQQQQQQQQIKQSKSFNKVSKKNYKDASNQMNIEEQVEEHFKRALGVNYYKYNQKNEYQNRLINSKRSHSDSELDSTTLNSEKLSNEKEAKQIKLDTSKNNHNINTVNNEDKNQNSSGSSSSSMADDPNFVDDHFSKALGKDLWNKLKETLNNNNNKKNAQKESFERSS